MGGEYVFTDSSDYVVPSRYVDLPVAEDGPVLAPMIRWRPVWVYTGEKVWGFVCVYEVLLDGGWDLGSMIREAFIVRLYALT